MVLYDSGPQPCRQQGLVLWKTTLLRGEGVWFQDDPHKEIITNIPCVWNSQQGLHSYENLMPPLIGQDVELKR